MLNILMNSPAAWVVLSACTVLSLAFAIFTWRKDRQKKIVSTLKTRYRITEKGTSHIRKLQLLFDGKSIDSLTITKFAIWNSGNGDIRREDVVSEAPICIKSKNALSTNILDAEIVAEGEPTNSFSIKTIDAEHIEFDFEYMDPHDGIVVQVMHSGDASDLYVDGKVKGGKIIPNFYEKKSKRRRSKGVKSKKIDPRKRSVFSVGFAILLLIVEFILMIVAEKNEPLKNAINDTSSFSNIPLIIVFAVGVVALIFAYVKMIREIYHLRLPTKLRKHIDIDTMEFYHA